MLLNGTVVTQAIVVPLGMIVCSDALVVKHRPGGRREGPVDPCSEYIFDHLNSKTSLSPSQFLCQQIEVSNSFLQPEDRNVRKSKDSSYKSRERGAFLVRIISLESIS